MGQGPGRALTSVQQLRGMAAIAVLLYHVSRVSGHEVGVLAAGVDVFFVLSGFILWTATRDAPPSPKQFLARRALRVLPLYWLITGAVLVGALALPDRFASVRLETWHVAASLLLIPHYDPSGGSFPIIPVAWTLSYEAVFYLVLAACLPLARGVRFRTLCLVLLSIPLVGLTWPPAYQLIANPMFAELAAGVWLAESRARGNLPSGRIGWMAVTVGLGAYAALESARGGWDLWRPFLWGPPAVLIVAGWVILEDGKRLPRAGWLSATGDASYAIYLLQDLAIGAVLWLLPSASPPILIASAALAAGLGGGWITWTLVERPVLQGLRSVVFPSTTRRP